MLRTVFLPKLAFALLLLSLSACLRSSPPTSFYTLTSLEPAARSAAPVATLGVGPVTLADYLDRPEIVTRSSAATLKIADAERWGGTLRTNVGRVLVANLGVLLAPAAFRVVPWESPLALDIRLALDFDRFEQEAGGKVVLDANWLLVTPTGQILAGGTTHRTATVAGESYDATVAAMSRALEDLSRELAIEAARVVPLP